MFNIVLYIFSFFIYVYFIFYISLNPFLFILVFIYFFYSSKNFIYFRFLDTLYLYIKNIFFNSLIVSYLKSLLLLLFLLILLRNFLGNIPLSFTPTLYYLVRLRLRLLFWLTLIFSVIKLNINDFISHLLPYGAPTALFFILPLIELLSQILRPFTLSIRLSTNLAAGHIILYIFSFFTLLIGNFRSAIVGICLLVLIILELFISLLQAYIFVTLVSLYYLEVEEIL